MDELLQRAPEAHAHLQGVADPELQERLGSAVMQLGHVDLYDVGVREDPISRRVTYSPVEAELMTSEQGEHADRATELMVRVAEVTAEASRVVEERKAASEEEYHYGPRYDVYGVARDIALERATAAFEQDDTQATRSELATMLAVTLVSASRGTDSGCDEQVRQIVGRGMATELYETARGMHGMIAVKQDLGSMHATSVPDVLGSTADLIRVASNTDFDDQMQHPTKLLRDGLPREDVDRQQEMIDGMEHAHIAALSRLAGDKLKNKDWAASLAIRAGEKLANSHGMRSVDDVPAATETISALTDFALQAPEASKRRRAETCFDLLRQVRSAGLKPYRINDPMTAILDRAMVRLALDGKAEAIRRLISASPHEAPPIDKPPHKTEAQDEGGSDEIDREFLDANLGWAIHTELEGADASTRYRAQKMLAELQTEKETALRERLLETGADPRVVDNIIRNSSDPDSAMEIPPEFWEAYNTITGQGQGEGAGGGLSPGDIKEIIEGSQSSDLATHAELISQLLQSGVDPYDVSRQVVRTARAIKAPDDRAEYMTQLASVIKYAKSEEAQAEIDDIFVRYSTFIETVCQFEKPEVAMAVARRLFGGKAPAELFKLYEVFRTHDPHKPITIDEDFAVSLDHISTAFGEQMLAELAVKGSFPLKELAQLPKEGVKQIVEAITTSPTLEKIVELGFGIDTLRSILQTRADGEPLQLLEATLADADHGILQTLQEYDGYPAVQKALLREVFNGKPDDMFVRTARLRGFFDDANLGAALVAHPSHAQEIIDQLHAGDHSKETVAMISDAMLDASLQVLTHEFVSADQASVIINRISTSANPGVTLQEMLRVYEETDFLQERGIDIDFASHVEEWVAFLDAIPEGREGELFRELAVKRLSLETGEDASQAIRIFSELAPDHDLQDEMRLDGFRLIYSLLGSETTRGFPSVKPGKLAEVFFDSELANLYRQAFLLKQAGNTEQLEALIGNLRPREEGPQLPLAMQISVLKEGVSRLTSQQKSATKWLRQYAGQDIRAVKLVEAWKAREFALARGIKDNPTDILYFVASEGLIMYATEKIASGQTDITLDEVDGYKDFAVQMGGRYGQDAMFRAVERLIKFRREHGYYPKKLIPAHNSIVSEAGRKFVAEIFEADDPRGMTIGYDTGCCMTLGGASESCIWAGYEDGRYSFMGVYDEDGRLRAQSIMYVAEVGEQRVLVIDNIEVNEGTDLSTIAAVYRSALLDMMRETEMQFDAIHIGVGYTPPEAIANLPQAQAHPTPKQGVYSDAASQRLLWTRGS